MSGIVRLGVVSDTHLPHFGHVLPDPLVRAFDGVDAILHLGDFTGAEVPGLFEAIARLEAVAGNNDGPDLVRRFGRQKILTINGVRIGMIHGDAPAARIPARLWARQAFAAERPDLICYGHSHVPELVQDGQTLVLNPGSPTDRRRMPDFSCAVVTLRDGAITAELHH